MLNLKNKKVTIIGLARSGMAVAEMVDRLGGVIKISEQADDKVKRALWDNWLLKHKAQLECGKHTQSFIEDSDMIVLSPGVRIDAEPVQWARARDIPVLGEIEFAYRFCPSPIIAVTGSNGKTTVSTLIKDVLTEAGKKVCLCGNIGTPLSKFVLDLVKDQIVVMEVSSFQLESIIEFRPHVAVFLNFNQNHLDRHKDLNEYFEAKKRIFINQTKDDFAVFNSEDPWVKKVSSQIQAKVLYFNEPSQLSASHNNPNHLAVQTVAKIFGISEELCQKVFRQFRGVEHRLEIVRTINGVDFINDSKSTTAESGRWALNSTARPIIMICGGRDKNIDFSVLRDLVRRKVKKMIAIGEAREKLKNTFQDIVPLEECDSLKQAVMRAKESSLEGDCVILSPMCASFDMFANYEERGKVFKEIVHEI